MTVKELKEELKNYDDNAEVVLVDWSNGRTYDDLTIGGDDEDEGTAYCRIGI